MDEVLSVANEFGLWIAASFVLIVTIIQVVLFYRRSMKAGKQIGLTEQELKKGFYTGIKTSIGPVMAVFIIMVGLMSVIGGPLAWMRLAIIGAAPTELTAAQFGADAYGVDFGGEGYNLEAMAVSWWTMIINGVGWLLFVGLFGDKLEKVREVLAGNKESWLPIMGSAASLGIFGYLNSGYVLDLGGPLIAVISGAISMIILIKISENYLKPLKEYSLGIAMVIGMALAIIFT